MKKKKIFFVLNLFLLSFLIGCAGMTFYKRIDLFIRQNDFNAANKIVEEKKGEYKGEKELLYYFDKGIILQLLGDYKNSIKYLNKAERKIESLYTKSITKEVSSFFTNDLSLPYEGEDFEKVMVHIIKALDFMYMGDFDGALVEARKVNHLMNVLNDRYEGKNIYKEDAFARYLSAFCYEAQKELNDAYIDYKKAYKVYKDYKKIFGTPIPGIIKKDILRMADALRFYDDIDEYKKMWGNINFMKYDDLKKLGEVLIIIYDGLAPYKISKKISATVHDEKGNPQVISVAFPYFKKRSFIVRKVEVLDGGLTKGYLGEDIQTIAIKTLENKNLLIKAKAIARAATKYFAAKKIQESTKGNLLVSLATNIYNYASEQADTRSWRTLPNRFHFVRVVLKPGKHILTVRLYLKRGGIREEKIKVKIKKGQKKVYPVFAFN